VDVVFVVEQLFGFEPVVAALAAVIEVVEETLVAAEVVEGAVLAVVGAVVAVVDVSVVVVSVADVSEVSLALVVFTAAVVFSEEAVDSSEAVVAVAAFLFFKSTLPFSSISSAFTLHSCANQTAEIKESAASHPPPIKHCSIWSKLSRLTSAARHFAMEKSSPQEFVIARESKLCKQPSSAAETTAAVAKSEIIDGRMLDCDQQDSRYHVL